MLEYDSAHNLIEVLGDAVVRPALEMSQRLILKKARGDPNPARQGLYGWRSGVTSNSGSFQFFQSTAKVNGRPSLEHAVLCLCEISRHNEARPRKDADSVTRG